MIFVPSESDVNKKGHILAHFNFSLSSQKSDTVQPQLAQCRGEYQKNLIITGLDNQGFKQLKEFSL